MTLALQTRPSSSLNRRLGRAVSTLLDLPARVLRHRRLLSTMAQMSDHELKDVGLSRIDVSDATSLPIASDVGLFLSARAGERDRFRVRRPV